MVWGSQEEPRIPPITSTVYINSILLWLLDISALYSWPSVTPVFLFQPFLFVLACPSTSIHIKRPPVGSSCVPPLCCFFARLPFINILIVSHYLVPKMVFTAPASSPAMPGKAVDIPTHQDPMANPEHQTFLTLSRCRISYSITSTGQCRMSRQKIPSRVACQGRHTRHWSGKTGSAHLPGHSNKNWASRSTKA